MLPHFLMSVVYVKTTKHSVCACVCAICVMWMGRRISVNVH